MKAIILSAGQGRRLMPLTANTPKCCLMLAGKTLLEHQLESLAANGIDEIVVVTGFGHRMVDQVVNKTRGISVRTLYNPFYALSDNLGTAWVARHEMKGPFLLVNGDTLFEASTLSYLLSGEHSFPITLATDHKGEYDDDDMKIITDGRQLKRVGKKLNMESVNGESIGMMVFNQKGAEAFVNKVETLMAGTGGLVRWYLSAIDELAMAGLVGINSINGSGWCEVDDHADLAYAQMTVSNWDRQALGAGVCISVNTGNVSGNMRFKPQF
ncbi:MAG: phosphocholine cytidylyltransferase family protein [Gammaproteobacteria bacterium]|nr:phosphocholine cytidylyltransferase family protein [Gammaproteobacteria bacterium]